MAIIIGRPNALPWQPHPATSADDIVVQVTDILFEYLPPNSGVSHETVVERVRAVVESPAGLSAYARDALQPDHTDAADVVVRLADALEQPSPHPKELVHRLLEVVETPLAIEVYDREMERRNPRDAGRWH